MIDVPTFHHIGDPDGHSTTRELRKILTTTVRNDERLLGAFWMAGAITPDDRPSLTLGDSEGDVLEEFGRAEGNADVGKR